jgi:hypothetical protein
MLRVSFTLHATRQLTLAVHAPDEERMKILTYECGEHVMIAEVVHLKLKYLRTETVRGWRKAKVLVGAKKSLISSTSQVAYRTKKLIYVLWVCVYNQLVNFFLPNFSAPGTWDERE